MSFADWGELPSRRSRPARGRRQSPPAAAGLLSRLISDRAHTRSSSLLTSDAGRHRPRTRVDRVTRTRDCRRAVLRPGRPSDLSVAAGTGTGASPDDPRGHGERAALREDRPIRRVRGTRRCSSGGIPRRCCWVQATRLAHGGPERFVRVPRGPRGSSAPLLPGRHHDVAAGPAPRGGAPAVQAVHERVTGPRRRRRPLRGLGLSL